ncbi:MAG TPA: BlaI/MecI/CopY family transcriptional regulator [Bryobacteraceae bacterium]|nr:BlaI/MecI/CopY family transcriptional regulator [Bryobacteraceae bacterium]
MAKDRRDIPPRLELECLKALWILEEASVREVREHLAPSRALAYTTVMTVLDRLVRRGGVQRSKVGRSFVYTPLMSREALRRLALREFVDSYFDGSEEDLRQYLSEQDFEKPTRKPAEKASEVEIKADAALV